MLGITSTVFAPCVYSMTIATGMSMTCSRLILLLPSQAKFLAFHFTILRGWCGRNRKYMILYSWKRHIAYHMHMHVHVHVYCMCCYASYIFMSNQSIPIDKLAITCWMILHCTVASSKPCAHHHSNLFPKAAWAAMYMYAQAQMTRRSGTCVCPGWVSHTGTVQFSQFHNSNTTCVLL